MGFVSTLIQEANAYGKQAAQFGYNKLLAAQQQDYNRANMATTHEYELENMSQSALLQQQNWESQFAQQNARQDYLLANADRLSMQSKRAAGINPAFANGAQAASVTPASAPAPTASSAATGTNGLPSVDAAPATDMVGAMMMDQQKDYMRSQTALNDAQAASILKKTDPEIADLLARRLANEASANQSNAAAEQIRTLTPYQVSQAIANTHLLDAQSTAIAQKLPYELKQIAASVALTNAQTATESHKQRNLDASTQNLIKQMDVYAATVQKYASEVFNNEAMTNHIWQLTQNAVIDGDIKNFEKEMWSAFPPSQRANYQKAKEIIDMGSDIVGSVGSLMLGGAAVGKVFGTVAPTVIKGFGR